MKQKSVLGKAPAEQVLKDIRRRTRRHYSAEEKIRIGVLKHSGRIYKDHNMRHDRAPETRVSACHHGGPADQSQCNQLHLH